MSYSVRYSHTSAVERVETLEAADAAVRAVFADPYTDAGIDPMGGVYRQRYWRDEESSADDDGARAIASITVSS